jgi:hypothetical protein
MSNEKEELKITFLDKVVKLSNGTTIMGRLILNPERDNENFIYIINPIELSVNMDGSGWTWRSWLPFSKSSIITIPVTKLLCVTEPNEDVLMEYIDNILNLNEEDTDESDDVLINSLPPASDLIH